MRLVYVTNPNLIESALSLPLTPENVLVSGVRLTRTVPGWASLLVSDVKGDDQMDRRIVHWIKEWAQSVRVHGEPLAQRYQVGGVALWPLVEYWLYDSPFFGWSVRRMLHSLETALQLWDKVSPSEVVIYGSSDPLSAALVMVAEERKTPVRVVKAPLSVRERLRGTRQALLPYLVEGFKTAKSVARFLTSRLMPRFRPRETKDVLVMSQAVSWQPVFDPVLGAERRMEAIVGGIVDRLGENGLGPLIALDFDSMPALGLKLFLGYTLPYVPAERYWEWEGFTLHWGSRRRFCQEWDIVSADQSFRESLQYENWNVWPLLRKALEHMFCYRLPDAAQAAYNALCTVQKIKPRVVMVTDEGNRTARSLIAAARCFGATTVALQHGALNNSYWHIQAEMESAFGDSNHPVYPVADLTLVFGEADRRRLVEEGNYPPNSVMVTGQPRYDVLMRGKAALRLEDVLGRIGLDRSRPMVLVASQPLSEAENKAMFNCIADAVAAVGGASLVFKLHPREREDFLHRAALQRVGIPGAVCRDISTHILLEACDVLVTRHSTVALEAMVLNKPVILLNLSGQPDGVPYAGGAYAIRSPEELPPLLRQLLGGEDPMVDTRKRFLSEHLAMDGTATDRVCSLVKRLAREGRRTWT